MLLASGIYPSSRSEQFRSRNDNFFSPIPKKFWDKGFYTGAAGQMETGSGGLSAYAGGHTGFTMKKRANKDSGSAILNISLDWQRSIHGQTFTSGYSGLPLASGNGITLPLAVDFNLYRNQGNFIKEVGTVCPLIGMGTEWHQTWSEQSVAGNGILAYLNLGTEFVLIPPSLALRAVIRPSFSYNTQSADSLDLFFAYKPDFSFRLFIQLSLITYIF